MDFATMSVDDPERLLGDQRWLLALARGLVGDEHAAEDIVQETRLLAWQHPPGTPARAGGWLRRIARNVASRMLARDDARAVRERAAAPSERVLPTDELVARVQMQRAVADAVLALAEPYRGVVLLRFFDGLPPRAIAERLGVPVETVRTRLKRALDQLRVRLDRDFGARDSWALVLLPWCGLSKSAAAATAVATSGAATAAAASGNATGGVVAMKVSTKVACGLIGAAAIGAGVWTWNATSRGSSSGVADARGAPAAATVAQTVEDPDVASSSAAASRSEVPGAEDASRTTKPFCERVHMTARILDEATGFPIEGATLSVRYGDAANLGSTTGGASDSEGRVSLSFGPVASNWCWYDVTHREHAFVPSTYAVLQGPAVDGVVEAPLGDVKMACGTRLSGHVVRLPERTPVANAELALSLTLVGQNEFTPASARPAGLSSIDGSFELPDRVASRETIVIYAATPTGAGWLFLKTQPGPEQLDDLEVAIEPPGQLDVRVVDDVGAPIADASLVAMPRFVPFGSPWGRGSEGLPTIAASTWRGLFTATSDRGGGASFSFLPEGRFDPLLGQYAGHMQSYVLWARAKGYANGKKGVLIEHGKRESIEVVLMRPHSSQLKGCVRDDEGAPIEGARVRLAQDQATTDAEGRYAIARAALDQGLYDVDVDADGFAPASYGATASYLAPQILRKRDADGHVTSEELTLDFTLKRATRLAGKVVDELGQPVVDAGIQASHVGDGGDGTLLQGVASDSDGRFVFANAAPGDWQLEVEPPDGYLRPVPVVARTGEEVMVRLLSKRNGRARLLAEVVDSVTGVPIVPERASVTSRWLGWRDSRSTTIEGSVVTSTQLLPGEWQLSVQAADGRRARRDFTIEREDDEVRLKVELGPNATIDGRVVIDEGIEVGSKERWFFFVTPGSNLSGDGGHAVDGEGRRVGDLTDNCAYADAEDRFRLVDVAPGVPMRIWLSHRTLFAEATVTLKPGEHAELEFHPRPAGTVEWKIGSVLPPGELTLSVSRDGGDAGLLTRAAAGRAGTKLLREPFATGPLHWRVQLVVAGEYPPHVLTAEGDVDVVANRTTTVEIAGLH